MCVCFYTLYIAYQKNLIVVVILFNFCLFGNKNFRTGMDHWGRWKILYHKVWRSNGRTECVCWERMNTAVKNPYCMVNKVHVNIESRTTCALIDAILQSTLKKCVKSTFKHKHSSSAYAWLKYNRMVSMEWL